MAEIVRYSDTDLEEFKAIIDTKIEETLEDITLLKSELNNSNHGTDDTGKSYNMMEDGQETLAREEAALQLSRKEKFLHNLKNALIRIENKSYGVCRVTGKLIQKERLRLVPHATLSIEAKQQQDR